MDIVSATSFSDQIRDRAVQTYIEPARKSGKTSISIAIPDLMDQFPEFAKGRQSIFCSALITKPFLRDNALVLEGKDGPESKRGKYVVYHYKLQPTSAPKPKAPIGIAEASRLAEHLLKPLQGLLAKEIAEHGGVGGYMKWVRSDEPTV